MQVAWNTVVMWTDKPKDDTEEDEEALITHHTHILYVASSLYEITMQHLSPLAPHTVHSWMWRTPRLEKMGHLSCCLTRLTTRSNCSRYYLPPYWTPLPHVIPDHTIHQQAETMHQMVETFEYDGEPHFSRTRVYAEPTHTQHAHAQTHVLVLR